MICEEEPSPCPSSSPRLTSSGISHATRVRSFVSPWEISTSVLKPAVNRMRGGGRVREKVLAYLT